MSQSEYRHKRPPWCHVPVTSLLLVLLVASITTGSADFFAPISTITNTIKYGDQTTTTQTTATFRCTESTPGGQFQIGSETFQVTCVPPRYTYLLNEYSRIPSYVELHQERACLVGNVAQFNASRQYEAALQAQQSETEVARRRRRLLFFDPIGAVALGVAIAAMVKAERAQSTADAALSLGKENEASLGHVEQVLSNLTVWTNENSNSIKNLAAGQEDIVTDLSVIKQTQNATFAAYATLLDMTKELARTTTENENRLQSDLLETRTVLAASLNTQSDHFSRALMNLTDLVAENEKRTQQNIQYILEQIQRAQENLLGVTTNVFDLYQNVQLRDMLTASFFDSKMQLDSTLKAMITDAGSSPFNGGQLLGADLRILIDTIALNFVVRVPNGSGYTLTVVSQVYNIYMDAYEAVKQSRPWTTFESLLKSIGPDPLCRRSYEGTDITDANLATAGIKTNMHKCLIWIEVVQSSCALASGVMREWKKMLPSLGPSAQPIHLDTTTCPSGSTIVTQTTLLRSMNEWRTHISSMACKQTLNPDARYFQFHISSLDAIMYVDQDTSMCDYTLNQINVLQSTAKISTIFGHMFNLLHYGFPNVLPRVYKARMKMKGRLPGGLSFETEPLTYTATQRDADGNVIYDGGADPHMCLNAYWLAMSRDTLPVMSAVPYPNLGVTKDVRFTRVAGNDCEVGDSTCYQVTSPSSNSIQLEDDMAFLLPGNFLMVGDPSLYRTTGIYDVPDKVISGSPSLRAGINHVDYYRMDPGTMETIDLSSFIAANGDGYRAQDGSLSAHQFRVGAVEDEMGYPVCDTQGGMPDGLQQSITAQSMCHGNTTLRLNFTQMVGRAGWSEACQLLDWLPANSSAAAAETMLPSFKVYDVFDADHAYGWTSQTLGGGSRQSLLGSFLMDSGVSSNDDLPHLSISWWFRIDETTAASILAQSPPSMNPTFDIPILELGGFVGIGMTVDFTRSTDQPLLCPRIVLNFERIGWGDPRSFVIGPSVGGSMIGPSVHCVPINALNVAHSFYLSIGMEPYKNTTTEGESEWRTIGGAKVRLWIDGDRVHDMTLDEGLSPIYNGIPEVVSESGTGHFQVYSSAFTPGRVVPRGAGAYGMTLLRPIRVPTVPSTMRLETDSDVRQLVGCMPQAMFGSACGIANATSSNGTPDVLSMRQDHRSRCEDHDYPTGKVLFVDIHDEVYYRPNLTNTARATEASSGTGSLTTWPATWSVTMWIRKPTREPSKSSPSTWLQDPIILLLLPNAVTVLYDRYSTIDSGGLLVCLNRGVEQLPPGSKFASWASSACRMTGTPLPDDGRPSFLTLSTSSDLLGVEVYLDGVKLTLTPYSPVVVLSEGLPASAGIKPVLYYSPWIEYLTRYDNYKLSTAQAVAEQKCQILSIFDVDQITDEPDWQHFWQVPRGVCSVESGTSTIGTCRTPTLCAGNCAATAVLNRTSRIFTPLSHVCDKGFRPPDCLFPCKRVNETSGYCLDVTSLALLRTGVVPNGQRCQLLKNFQENPSTINDQRILTYTPRVWSYLTTLTVPSGQIISLVPTGSCPAISSYELGDGGLAIKMQNMEAIDTRVLVQYYYTDRIRQELDSCTGANPICCDFAGQSFVIQSMTSQSRRIPSGCGEITVFVSLQTSGSNTAPTLCTNITANSLALLVVGDAIADIVQTRVSVAVDQVALSMTEQSAAITQNILHVMAMAAKVSMQSEAAVQYIESLTQSLLENKQPEIVFTNNLTTAYQLVNPELELLAEQQLKAARELLQASVDLQQNHTANLAALSASIAAADAAKDATDGAMRLLADSLVNRTAFIIPSASFCSDGNIFIQITCTIGEIAETAVKTSVGLVGGVAEAVVDTSSSALGSLFGVSGGGFFDWLLQIIQTVIIICIVAAIAYFAWQYWESRQAEKRLANNVSYAVRRTQSGLDFDGITSRQPQMHLPSQDLQQTHAQATTSGLFNGYHRRISEHTAMIASLDGNSSAEDDGSNTW